MASRRGHGEGSIYQRSDGRWSASVDLGYVDGKRKRKQIYGTTRKEVAERLKVLLRDQQQGLPVSNDRLTVEQFLERWLEETVKPNRRPGTYSNYSTILHTYVIPAIGRTPLSKLTAQDVERVLYTLQQRELSVGTRRHVRRVLSIALARAVKWDVVPRNVAALTDAPQGAAAETTALDAAQAQRLLTALRGTAIEMLITLALGTGMRQGELLGLRWQDVDFEARRVHIEVAMTNVRKQPRQFGPLKTASSKRTIPLADYLVVALRNHRRQQLEQRLLAGSNWQDWDLVFTNTKGGPLVPTTLRANLQAALVKAELPPIRFHDLRHSCASILAARGVPGRVVMEILGHSDIRMTQNIYTHIFNEAKDAAAEAMNDLLDPEKQAS